MSSSISWDRFNRRINVKADQEKLYEAWSTSRGIESWFLSEVTYTAPDNSIRAKEEKIKAGDKYTWQWYGWPDYAEKGEILAVNDKDMVQFTFGQVCTVTVKIGEERGENIVELIQENIPEEQDPSKNLVIACGQGWTFYMANLKSILEGGIDLRNKNDDLKNMLNS